MSAEHSTGKLRQDTCCSCGKSFLRAKGFSLTCFRCLFMAKVQKTEGCWLWIGHRHKGKYCYGRIGMNGKMIYAHRTAYLLFVGPIPEGKYVLHDCPDGDNPCCVNPAHLWLGTYKDNRRDCIEKGRANSATGSRHGRAKLTESLVRVLRDEFASGATRPALALKYRLSETQIGNIVLRRHWRKC
jgi:hypothetical protein